MPSPSSASPRRSRTSRSSAKKSYHLDSGDKEFEQSLMQYNDELYESSEDKDESAQGEGGGDQNGDEAASVEVESEDESSASVFSNDDNVNQEETEEENEVAAEGKTQDNYQADEEDKSHQDPGDCLESEVKPPPKRAKITLQKKDGSKHVCSNCSSAFKTTAGLNYHIKNRVCHEDKESSTSETGKRKAEDQFSLSNEKKPKFRGPEKNRTCPLCQRVFTSVFGYRYHRNHAVCSQSALFSTLEAGEEFETPYGIVRVLRDDRATPQAPSNIPKKSAKKKKHRKDPLSIQLALTTQSLRRRKQLGSMYEEGSITQAGVFQVCYGGNPSEIPTEDHVQPLQRAVEEKELPLEACPFRQVECLLISDLRHVVDEERNVVESIPLMEEAGLDAKLFLCRHELETSYKGSDSRLKCTDCGKHFTVRPSYTYHTQQQACVKKQAKKAKVRNQTIKSAETAAERELKLKKSHKKKKKSRKAAPTVEKEVNENKAVSGDEPAVVRNPKKSIKERVLENAEHPDDLLRRLNLEYRKEQSKLLGPMYTDVFKKLRYKIHVEKKPKRKRAEKEKTKEEHKVPPLPRQAPQPNMSTIMFPPAAALYSAMHASWIPQPENPCEEVDVPSVSDVPIVDSSVLIAEIESGRYPSMKRDPKRSNSKQCNVCKKKNTDGLISCDFCARSVHYKCMRTRYLTKFPEGDDDFLCNMCIQYMGHRRNRAERRRVARLGREFETEQEHAQRVSMLTTGIVSGREYECVAVRGQRISDLKELLRETRLHLELQAEAAKTNRLRRKMIQGNVDTLF